MHAQLPDDSPDVSVKLQLDALLARTPDDLKTFSQVTAKDTSQVRNHV